MVAASFGAPALGAIGWYLQQERSSGRFQQVDEYFEDFLIANGRDRFETPIAAPAASPVVLIRLREEDAAEYASWPPPPIDWRMILEGLKEYQPEVIVITQSLNWGKPAPEFIPGLGGEHAGLSQHRSGHGRPDFCPQRRFRPKTPPPLSRVNWTPDLPAFPESAAMPVLRRS